MVRWGPQRRGAVDPSAPPTRFVVSWGLSHLWAYGAEHSCGSGGKGVGMQERGIAIGALTSRGEGKTISLIDCAFS